MSDGSTAERYRQIRASNYGRDGGWTMELAGAPIAMLTEPRSEDMFWVSYRVEVVAADPEMREAMRTDAFWATLVERGVVWRSAAFHEIVPLALPAGNGIDSPPFTADGRLLMRGLYLDAPDPVLIRFLHRVEAWVLKVVGSLPL